MTTATAERTRIPVDVMHGCDEETIWVIAEGHFPVRAFRRDAAEALRGSQSWVADDLFKEDPEIRRAFYAAKVVRAWEVTRIEVPDGEWCDPGSVAIEYLTEDPGDVGDATVRLVTYVVFG